MPSNLECCSIGSTKEARLPTPTMGSCNTTNCPISCRTYLPSWSSPTWANENRYFIYNTYGFYAQDDWRATSRLTVNLGLRYEFMNTPHELQGKESRLINDYSDLFTPGPVIKNNSLRDLSPRVGMAYDLFGNGKTAIRGGAGIYYDIGNIGSSLGGTTNGAIPYG